MMKLFNARRGLSPIFATLILIAIAVIAGIVVYMFTSGTISAMTGGGTAGQEKAAVQGVDVTTGAVLAQNTGGVEITINGYIIKDASGNVAAQEALTTLVALTTDGALKSIPVTLPAPAAQAMSYTVTLTSTRGGSFVSSSFVIPAGTA